MALTIVTGTPGAGKTALLVSMLKDLVDKATEQNPLRRVYVMGIQELLLPHEPTPPLADWTEMRPAPEDPSLLVPTFTFEPGSLVIISEAQLVFRNRAPGSAVPPHVSAMERHRHLGIDFWIDTQGAGLLDPNIRKLCSRHLHIRSLWIGRKLYEWSEVTDPEPRSNRESAAVINYKLPKKVFGLYKSAQVHTKQAKRIPFLAYVVAVAVVAVPVLGWRLYDSVTARLGPSVSASDMGAVSLSSDVPSTPGSSSPSAKVVGSDWSEYVPRIPSKPETAPLYDSVRQVKAMPVIAGCVVMRDRCACFTQQGTPAGLSEGECRTWLENPPFNPYFESGLPVSAPVGQSG